ncbi:GNAT family N-acetyltransferase [Pseudomonas syringae group genomosp. 7]|uniref:GNAT family N-acetyltransferase n=1 Tax=Pseudomonas syringae group genomosp. 7 TaxID=251699 RepID=UPI000F00C8FA|nr:GNAT family N-acetyltransferase [Pseudomonas syringae group genomosp. 7]RMR04798.1 N-acetyltransferase GCN5 [Pseudomonas syringae pv. helianthi]
MITIRSMTLADYEPVVELMRNTPGISIRDADSRESTVRYLERNPGLTFVAEADGVIYGCVMCGHDGRRGYLQHLIVSPEYRRQGIARALVERCLECLEGLGIYKCHLDVLKGNEAAGQYWRGQGWTLREDIDRYSKVRRGGENA